MPAPKNTHARGWTILWMAFLAVALLVFYNIGRQAMHMQTAAAANNGQQVTTAPAGTQIKAVVQLISAGDGSAQGVVLEKESENVYRRTKQNIQVSFPKDVNVVMGAIPDVRKDAVVHVTGTVDPNRVLQVSRIVILTGYVTVH